MVLLVWLGCRGDLFGFVCVVENDAYGFDV